MTRTATRVAAAVGATVVVMGLATPALAYIKNQPSGAVAVSPDPAQSTEQAKNDPGKAFHKYDKWMSLTLADLQARLDAKIADGLAWLDAIEAKVSASDRLSGEQKSTFLAKLKAKEDALTQLRADVAAASSVDEVKGALKAADLGLFGRCGWHHGRHFGNHDHNGRFSDRHHNGGLVGFGGDSNRRHGDGRWAGGSAHRAGGSARWAGGSARWAGGNVRRVGGSARRGGNH